MEQVLLVVAAIVALWFVIAVVLALAIGRAIKLADRRQPVRRAASAAPRPAQRRAASVTTRVPASAR